MNGSSTISVPLDGGLFNFRVAGVAVCKDKILLHKTPTDNFWSLPGGRADLFEFTRETLLREMMEETGMQVDVTDLMWVVENFFSYNGNRYHEVGFYYKMRITSLKDLRDFQAVEEGSQLLFKWHEIASLHEIPIYPAFITADMILNTTHTRHITSNFRDLDAG
jgi:8-oxo-dGTP pyrophosphatase MutT (NUDIX family)